METSKIIDELGFEEGSTPQIFSMITRINKNLIKFQKMVLNKTNLTPPQFAILHALKLREKTGLSLSQLAQLTYSSRPTITNLIDTLEKKSLVIRVPNPQDRRSFLIQLTYEGNEVIEEAPSVIHVYADCCSILTSEETQILSSNLIKVNDALKRFLKQGIEN